MPWQIDYFAEVNETAKDDFDREFAKARSKVRADKKDLESRWFGKAGQEKLTEKAWFKNHYATAGAMIGSSRRLKKAMDELTKCDRYQVQRDSNGWTVKVIKTGEEPKLLCKVRVYSPPTEVPALLPGHHRAVYHINSKQYVLDDAGIPTRRYAYCVRQKGENNAPLLKDLPDRKMLRWKFSNTGSNEWNDAMTKAVEEISKGREAWAELSVESKICLAYLNYANNGKLGVCLSSTPKRIRDNSGKAFANTEEHLIWKVDLAKIPHESVLINIYAREPKSEGTWTAAKGAGRKTERSAKDGEWISQGTVKNRELFCSRVPPEAAQSKPIYAALLEADKWSWKKEPWFCEEIAPPIDEDALNERS